jgi:hypothetical protein
MSVQSGQENYEAGPAFVVRVPGMVGRGAMVAKDDGSRTVSILQGGPLNVVLAPDDQGLVAGDQLHATATLSNLFPGFT